MKFLKKLILIILILIIICFISIYFMGNNLYQKKLGTSTLEEIVIDIKSDPNYIKYNDLPQNYLNAIIAVEDHRFYKHGAIDFIAISRAVYTNVSNRELREGGSTITQQVAKNLLYISEDGNIIARKSAELLTSYDLIKKYSKEDILELYANTIYFGDGYYGIEEACKGYLNKNAKDMNLTDCTMMAGIPNAPSIYAPTANPDLTKNRQEKVISDMTKYGYLPQSDANELINNLDTYYKKNNF